MSLFIWDTGVNYRLYQNYLLIPLFSCYSILAFVEAFIFHDGAASNQRRPAPKAEKELNDRNIKKLNRLIAKMWQAVNLELPNIIVI